MIKNTQFKKVYKYDNHIINMKMRGYSVNCIISNSQSKGFYNGASSIKLRGIVTI